MNKKSLVECQKRPKWHYTTDYSLLFYPYYPELLTRLAYIFYFRTVCISFLSLEALEVEMANWFNRFSRFLTSTGTAHVLGKIQIWLQSFYRGCLIRYKKGCLSYRISTSYKSKMKGVYSFIFFCLLFSMILGQSYRKYLWVNSKVNAWKDYTLAILFFSVVSVLLRKETFCRSIITHPQHCLR